MIKVVVVISYLLVTRQRQAQAIGLMADPTIFMAISPTISAWIKLRLLLCFW